MTHPKQRFFMLLAAILTGLLIWVGSVITAGGTPKDDPDRLTMLSKMDRAALTQAARHPDNGILVTDDQGRVLFSRHPDTPRVPASILKILTSHAALSAHSIAHTPSPFR